MTTTASQLPAKKGRQADEKADKKSDIKNSKEKREKDRAKAKRDFQQLQIQAKLDVKTSLNTSQFSNNFNFFCCLSILGKGPFLKPFARKHGKSLSLIWAYVKNFIHL